MTNPSPPPPSAPDPRAGITIHAAPAARVDAAPTIRILDPAPPHPDPAAERVWVALRADQPRLHDGPILLLDPAAPADPAHITCRRGTYKSLATAPILNRPIRALGVQGVVLAHDRAGKPHALFGRRSADTRIYPGQWELAPSGSVPSPAAPATTLGPPDLLRILLDEGLEELGFSLDAARPEYLGTLNDPEARTLDILIRLTLPDPVDPARLWCPAGDTHRWEYLDAAWVATAAIGPWLAPNPEAFSPPTRAMLGWLGWA